MAKIGQNAKAIGFAKLSVWFKNLKLPKTCQKRLQRHVKVVLCKKRPQNPPKYSRNDKFAKMAKIGHNTKAIGLAKW